MVHKDDCPCCGKKMVSVVSVSAEAKAVIDSLVPDENGFVLVDVGLVRSVERKAKRTRKKPKL
ncbi:hypothetical protein ES702_05555 [subsurface metagenome]